jgi:hypothetical protein
VNTCCGLWTCFVFEFDVHVAVHRDKFLIIRVERTRRTNFPKFLFWNETVRGSDSSSVHHQEFSTVHTAMAYVIQVFSQLASRIRMELQFHPGPAHKLTANVYDIPSR